MAYLLAPAHLPRLAHFASSNVLVAFDYDGTLAPIASTPGRARMRLRTRELLTTIALRYPCVVISGRSRDDLATKVGGVPIWHLSGNHGVEPWDPNPAHAAQVAEWTHRLERRLNKFPGVVIENKKYSVTIHYRQATQKQRVMKAIDETLGALRGARTVGGKQAVNLVPHGAADKGVALERARRMLVCDTAIYVGDDVTDEDAFTMAHPERVLSIRVGLRRRSKAQYYLKDQKEMDTLLEMLVAFRPLKHAVTRGLPHHG